MIEEYPSTVNALLSRGGGVGGGKGAPFLRGDLIKRGYTCIKRGGGGFSNHIVVRIHVKEIEWTFWMLSDAYAILQAGKPRATVQQREPNIVIIFLLTL